jgi:type VI secretion system secreted protein Hcp
VAVSDYFLKIDGIEGESQDSKHKGEIELRSWSWCETNTGSSAYGGGGGTGKISMQDFHFTKKLDKASPKLMEACAKGKSCPTAVAVVRKAGGEQQDYMKITFSDVFISSYSIGGSGGDDPIPMDTVSFNFGKIDFEYKEQKADGTLGGATSGKYDLKTNKAG